MELDFAGAIVEDYRIDGVRALPTSSHSCHGTQCGLTGTWSLPHPSKVTMLTPSRAAASLLALATICAVISIGPVLRAQQNGATLALVGGTIYVDPIAEPIRNGVVLVQNGRIARVGDRQSLPIPRETPTIDCSNLTVVAGYWNSHVHFLQRKWADAATLPASELAQQLQSMLTQYGFTTVFDTWSPWENTRRIRDRVESGETAGRSPFHWRAMFGKGTPCRRPRGRPRFHSAGTISRWRVSLPRQARTASLACWIEGLMAVLRRDAGPLRARGAGSSDGRWCREATVWKTRLLIRVASRDCWPRKCRRGRDRPRL